ncbi:MAG: shikimate kinase [Rhodospirillales bacterium]
MTNINSSNSGLIVLVGLMGAGKTSVGRKVAQRFDLAFTDTDDEIVKAAGCSIVDIFELYGEQEFREGERRVILRLLEGEPQVIATGGGAFMDPVIRERIEEKGISVWLRAELDILVDRTAHLNHRPLLQSGNPRETLQNLMDERYPIYAQANIVVNNGPESSDFTANQVVEALNEKNFIPKPTNGTTS